MPTRGLATLTRLRPPTQASCHGDRPTTGAAPVSDSVALVGNPNIGKSTLFNALTGGHRRVGNWQGTSVEVGRGTWTIDDALALPLLDLPGAVSLDAVSPDEDLTRDLLYGGTCACDHGPQTCDEIACACRAAARPRLTVVLLDASDLARGLYLLRQVRELPTRVVVAMSMNDIAARRGRTVDPDALAAHLGVPVVPVDPRRRTGIDALGDAVRDSLAMPVPPALPVPVPPALPVPVPPALPVPDVDANHGRVDTDAELARADARFAWILDVAGAVTRHDGGTRETWPDRLDKLATGRITGPVLFLGVMWALFRLTTSVAAPLQGMLGDWISGPFSDAGRSALAGIGLGGGFVEGLLIDGLVNGVGTVLSFIPLMALIFLALAVLEDSGYLARAAVVTDRLMRAVGLPGRAFLPLTVGFGCNVPAVSATRALPDARHRLLTTLLVPFTTCSARLPVYVMVGSVFFGAHSGDVVFAMYVLSIVLVVLTGIALRKTLLRAVAPDPLVLDLPRYQRPALRVLASSVWMRLFDFLRTAGGVIVAAVVVVWLLGAIALPASWLPDSGRPAGTPSAAASSSAGAASGVGDGFAVSAQTPVERSLYRGLAELAEPGLTPAGFGDWHASGALLVGFVAKEAVISSWAQTYSGEQAQTPGGGQTEAMRAALERDFTRTSGGSPVPAALAFCAFLLAYTPCAATLAAQKREVGWRWTLTGVGVQMVVAWLLAVLVFQVGRLLW